MSLLEDIKNSNGILMRIKDTTNSRGWSPLLPITHSKYVIEDTNRRFVSQLEKNKLGTLTNGLLNSEGSLYLNANLINTGELDAGKVKIIGSNGRITLFDNYLRISTYEHKDGSTIPQLYERIFLGVETDEDGNEIAKLVIRNDNGETAILDHTGLTKVAFTDGWNKADKNSLDGTKIDIESLISHLNEDGTTTINSSKIFMNDKTLDVAFTEMEGTTKQLATDLKLTAEGLDLKVSKTTYDSYVSQMDLTIEELRNNLNYSITISSSNGTLFNYKNIDSVFTPIVYKGGKDITDAFTDAWFIWSRQSNNTVSDNLWNNNHLTGSKSLHITDDDFYQLATFNVELIKPE